MKTIEYKVVWAGGVKTFSALLPAVHFAQQERKGNYINSDIPRLVDFYRIETYVDQLEIPNE